MDSCSEVSPPNHDNCKQPVILSYHSLNLDSHSTTTYKVKAKSQSQDVISPAKSLYHSTSSSNSLQMEDEDTNPDYSFGLSYNDHCYAQVAGCPLKQQSPNQYEKESAIFSHSIDDILTDSFLSSIPSSDNSLDLLAKVAQAMGPVHSNSRKLSLLDSVGLRDDDCSLLYTPDISKLHNSMDYNWTAALEEVTATAAVISPSSNSSHKKTVSLVIPRHTLAAYQRMKSATLTLGSSPQTSPGVSRSISVPQENNLDLDLEPKSATTNSQQPATIKLLKPGSLPIKKLPPLRRYRYSGLPNNNANITRLNNSSGGNGLVFTYGAGIIPASNAHVGPITCPCGYTHDDGYMIQCDNCKIWQHVDCVLREPNNLPANYMCDACLPRNVNYNRAVTVQRQKLAQHQTKKLQHQEIAHQQNQIQQQLIARGLHSSPNHRTSKRKQDLQSLSGESTDYAEHLTRLPSSSPNNSQSVDQITSPHPSGVNPCSPQIGGCTTVITSNGSAIISNLAANVTVSSTGAAYIPARNLFLSPPSGGEELLQQHSITSDIEVESSISPNTRFSSFTGNNGYVDNYETVPARSNIYSSNQYAEGSASLNNHWTNNSTQQQQQHPNNNGILFNSSASFSHGLPMNHADYDEIRENICTEELRQMLKHKYEAGRLLCYNFKESRPSHPPLTRVVALDFTRKRLEAARYITRSTVVMEYRGCLSLFDEYNYEYDYRKHYNPFVLFYNKLVNVSLCVDARHCGNSARFIRRSCHPNCEVFHIYSSGRIQLLIVANDDIAPGRELTLPFDFDFTKCRYQITCACGRKACQVARWYRSQDKSHYQVPRSPNYNIPTLNRNNVSVLKKVTPDGQPKILASRDQKYQKYISKKAGIPSGNVDYHEPDDDNSQSEEELIRHTDLFTKSRKLSRPDNNTTNRINSDIYNFSDNEAKKEKKHRLLKTISNKSRQQRLHQQISRKLNSTARPLKGIKSGGRGSRGRGALSGRVAASVSRVKRPSGSSVASKRRASQAFSHDDESESSDNENEENTPASTTPRQRRQSTKSSDSVAQPTIKKENESSQPQAKKSREDIWLAEVLKRIERLEKKKRKKCETTCEDQHTDYRSSGELNGRDDSNETITFSNNDSNIVKSVDHMMNEDIKTTNQIDKEGGGINDQFESAANQCNGLDDSEMVIRYHRTSITELQEDIDAISRAVPDLQDSVKCNDTAGRTDMKERLLDTQAVTNCSHSTVATCENSDSKQPKQKRLPKTTKNNTKLVELNFNDFIQELIPEEQKMDVSSKNETKMDYTNESMEIDEKTSPMSPGKDDNKPHYCALNREEQQQEPTSPQRRKSEENNKKSADINHKTLKESRDEKWLRLQLKKIEEMEKKITNKKALSLEPAAPPPPPPSKSDSLDDTMDEVLSRLKEESSAESWYDDPSKAAGENTSPIKPEDKSGTPIDSNNKINPRRRRQSSKEDAPNTNSKKSRKNSSDNGNAVENGKRSRKASQNNSEIDSTKAITKKSNSTPFEVVDKQNDEDKRFINSVDTSPNSPKKNIETLDAALLPVRKSCSENQDGEFKEHIVFQSIRSENDNLSSTSSDTDSETNDEGKDEKIEPIGLQAKRRSSAPSGPETRSRVNRSGKKPSAQMRTPTTAIEYQDRTAVVKTPTKKVSDNWQEQECNLIVYKPQVENPMERFSRSLSTNLPVVSQNSNSNVVTTNTVMPTPTKKRWLNQAILEDEENNFNHDNAAQLINNSAPNTAATTPLPTQFSLKKRLMAQYSVDDHCSSSPEIHESSLINESFSLTQNHLLLSNEKPPPQTLPAFTSPTAKLPPKKATMKRREEERILMEMRKIRVSLSEYRKRRGNADTPHTSMEENALFKNSDELYYLPDSVNICNTNIDHHASYQQMKLSTAELVDISVNADDTISFNDTLDQETDIADYASVNEDCGPRTPSEPNDDEEEDAEKPSIHYQQADITDTLTERDNVDDPSLDESCLMEVADSVNKEVNSGGPKTPEMDENEDTEINTTCNEDSAAMVSPDDRAQIKDDTMEPTVTTTTENDSKVQEFSNDDNINEEEEEEDFEKVKIDEEDLEKRISKLYPSLSNDEEDVMSLNNILKRDEEIRDMQELKTLERQKNKLLYQLRSVERVLPSDQESKSGSSVTPSAPCDPSSSIPLVEATVAAMNVAALKFSCAGMQEPINTISPLSMKTKPVISPAKSSSSIGRMPLSEKAISPTVPIKKITPNLSVLDAAIKNMQSSLKAQLAAAQKNIKSNYSLLNSSNNSASSSHDQRTKPRS